MLKDYRETIYGEYASEFNEAGPTIQLEKMEGLWPAYRYLLKDWLPKDKDAQIIDLGCGDGGMLHYLKKKEGYTRVFGVDISPAQVRLAKMHMQEVKLQDALEYLRNTSLQYDLILAFDLIEHLEKSEVLEFLALCHIKLNRKGRLVLQTPNGASPFFGSARYGDFTHEIGLTAGLLSKLLKKAGFVSIESRESCPVPFGYSVVSTIRYLMWQLVRLLLCLYSIIETGSRGDNICTRVFVQSGVKE